MLASDHRKIVARRTYPYAATRFVNTTGRIDQGKAKQENERSECLAPQGHKQNWRTEKAQSNTSSLEYMLLVQLFSPSEETGYLHYLKVKKNRVIADPVLNLQLYYVLILRMLWSEQRDSQSGRHCCRCRQ